MADKEFWIPEQYVKGNYFQNEINNLFQKLYDVKLDGAILDVGCGDGKYSRLVADNTPQGQVLAIDSSPGMIKHAKHYWEGGNLLFDIQNIEKYQPPPVFDFIISFWCLHWTRINASFAHIYQGLKKDGTFYAVFSSFSDNSIKQALQELARQKRYDDLPRAYIDARNENRKFLFRVINTLSRLPFRTFKLNLKTIEIEMPDIEYFRNLLRAMPFIKKYPPERADHLIDELSKVFQLRCQRKHQGRLCYESRPIFLEAVK